MNKNEIFREILRLTTNPDWVNDPAKVERVQKLGRLLNGNLNKREKRTRKCIGVYQNERLLYEGDSKTLAVLFGLSETTMNNRARLNHIDSEGRTFKYLDKKANKKSKTRKDLSHGKN